MSRTYAKFPEVKSERITQDKSRQHYGTVVVVEIQKKCISDITFNYFYSDSRKVPMIKAGVLTVDIQHLTTREQLIYSARLFCGTNKGTSRGGRLRF